jgi:hypothetical protein
MLCGIFGENHPFYLGVFDIIKLAIICTKMF